MSELPSLLKQTLSSLQISLLYNILVSYTHARSGTITMRNAEHISALEIIYKQYNTFVVWCGGEIHCGIERVKIF